MSAPYPEISWTSPWLFQAPYPSPSPCPSPCPGPCPCLYLYPFPCLGPSLCSPFPFHVLCLSPLLLSALFPFPFLVLCLDHAGPYLFPSPPFLCYIFPPQSRQKARNQEDMHVKDELFSRQNDFILKTQISRAIQHRLPKHKVNSN